ncbi:MAG: type II secretion system protein GspG [Candidatus Brocadiae bacterium]|nr:type II secretion system protein GspG [Candidatus Brocadiia bacterium]
MARKINYGFTILELVVTIAIIAILAGVSTVVVSNILEDAKLTKAKTDVKVLAEAILNVYRDTTVWPQDNPINTVDLWNNPRNGLFRTATGGLSARYPARAWKGPYLNKLVETDPWGTSYRYQAVGTIRGVASCGPNRAYNNSFNQLQAQVDDIVFYIQ